MVCFFVYKIMELTWDYYTYRSYEYYKCCDYAVNIGDVGYRVIIK